MIIRARHDPTWPVAVLIIILVFQIVAHLAWLPLLTSLGQMAVPWMMSQDMTLYGNIRTGYNPGTMVILATAMRILPLEPIDTLRLMDTMLVIVTTLMVFRIAYQLSNGRNTAAVAAAMVWALWEPIWGNTMFYPDKLLGLIPLLAVFLYITAEQRTLHSLAPFLAGISLGAGFLVKQHGLAMIGFFSLWLLVFAPSGRKRLSAALVYGAGVILLPLISVVIIALQGNWDQYLLWTLTIHFKGNPTAVPLAGDFLRRMLLSEIFTLPFVLLILKQTPALRRWWWMAIYLWVGAHALVIPRWGDNHMGTQLPLTAVMSGVVVGLVLSELPGLSRRWPRDLSQTQLGLLGIGGILAGLWLFTCVSAYVPHPLGRLATPGYSEFDEVARVIDENSRPDDTLGIIPEWDATAQLHVRTGLLPVGNWYYTGIDFMSVINYPLDILAGWEATPPTFIVYVPDARLDLGAYVDPLIDFMTEHYTLITVVRDVPYHGNIEILRWRS